MSFQLPNLSYDHSALEPHIDSKTMQIHHGKHHAGYTNKLNAAINGTDLAGKSIEEILKSLDMNNTAVRNNGGGYYNHCLFWEIIGPNCGVILLEILPVRLTRILVLLKNSNQYFLALLELGLVLVGLGYAQTQMVV